MKSLVQIMELRRDGAKIQIQAEGLRVSAVIHSEKLLFNLDDKQS